MKYLRPTHSVIYHVVVNATRTSYVFRAACGRMIYRDRIGDARNTRPAQVCARCEATSA